MFYVSALNVLIFSLIWISIQCVEQILKSLQSHPNWKLLDRDDDCGYSSSDRIIGGVKATLGQYPWIARLGYSFELDPDTPTVDLYQCGGTIISDRYILTAAHCSPEQQGIKMIQVRLGEYNVNTNPDCVDEKVCAPAVQDIDVEDYVCHQNYNDSTLHNDICLIRLAKPIQFNRYVQPICLPTYEAFIKNDFAGSVMEVAGWGITDIYTLKTSDVLLTLKVPVMSHERCVDAYQGKAPIVETQMCAGGVIGKDSCSGDSGGPLMTAFSMDAPPRFFIIGVVSFGLKKCADTETPGVYSKVPRYMKWILDNVRE